MLTNFFCRICLSSASATSVLYEVSKIDDVKRLWMKEQIDLFRPLLDYHFQTLALLGGVKRKLVSCVIRQLNIRMEELTGTRT